MAYRLELPPHARLHDVFHVGLLKKFVGTPPSAPPALPPVYHGAAVPELEHVIRSCLARGVRQLLVHWKGESAASATREDADSFIDRYPNFQLEDELLVEGEEMSCGAATTAAGPACRSNSRRPPTDRREVRHGGMQIS